MAEDVKRRRRYDSPRRREQAAATRRAILEAAERRFEAKGYVSTSVQEIADEAGVALKTVYAVFGTKAEVLRELWNLRLRGDEEPMPLTERREFRAILDEPSPRRRLALGAHNARTIRERTAGVAEVVREAAPADPRIGALWERFQRELYEVGMRSVVDTLRRDGVLALDPVEATDLLWTLIHPDVYQLLVRQRGWSPEQYEQWLVKTLRQQLLRRR